MPTWESERKEAKRTVPIGDTGEDQTEKYSDVVIFPSGQDGLQCVGGEKKNLCQVLLTLWAGI